MLVKDLLVMFQAGNEGVCNILGTLSFFSLGVYLLISAEHYFEMSKSDAREAYDVYKYFIKQTDSVVDYLGVARKLHNVVNVPVPNLKHAPTGLVKALEEYLNDPNFEQNRIEYRRSLGVVEGKSSARAPSPGGKSSLSSETAFAKGHAALASQKVDKPPPARSSAPTPAPAPTNAAPPGASQTIQDFFDSIQADHQPTMFNGPAQGYVLDLFIQVDTDILQLPTADAAVLRPATAFQPFPSIHDDAPANRLRSTANDRLPNGTAATVPIPADRSNEFWTTAAATNVSATAATLHSAATDWIP